jgi:hypothetical protein
VATQTHDYKRHGTTTFFAALNLADGKVIGTCQQRHRHQEWLRFLRLTDQGTPPPPAPRGSTWSNDSSATSPSTASGAASSKSLDELHQAIAAYLAAHNHSPKPFIWTAKASEILAKVQRARSSQNNT